MNWKLKAHVLATLSRMPGGRSLYHTLQSLAGTNRLQTRRDLDRAFELIDLIQQTGRSVDTGTVLEVGTGWRPFVPMVFALAGAKSVVTVDVNPWLTLNYAKETWAALRDHLEEIAAHARVPYSEVKDRYHQVDADVSSLDQFLSQIGIKYIYPGDARETGLAADSVHYVVSSNVLEHIPYDIQAAIHVESLRVLVPGGLAVHRFNPQDHYSTVDGTISNANFLQFSEKAWNWYGGSGLAYHNRLRAPEYRKVFKEAGFAIEVCRERVDEPSLKLIQSAELRIADCFKKYTDEELAVDYMWMACAKPNVVVPSEANEKLSQSTEIS